MLQIHPKQRATFLHRLRHCKLLSIYHKRSAGQRPYICRHLPRGPRDHPSCKTIIIVWRRSSMDKKKQSKLFWYNNGFIPSQPITKNYRRTSERKSDCIETIWTQRVQRVTQTDRTDQKNKYAKPFQTTTWKLASNFEANKKVADFLDVTLDMNKGTYKPFIKPNNTPLYVHHVPGEQPPPLHH